MVLSKSRIFTIIILLFSLFISCKKDEIHILRKGKWNINWYCAGSPNGSPCYTGKISFNSGWDGIFYPSGTSDKVPFSYTVSDQTDTATFQFSNPNSNNTIHIFDILIKQDTPVVLSLTAGDLECK